MASNPLHSQMFHPNSQVILQLCSAKPIQLPDTQFSFNKTLSEENFQLYAFDTGPFKKRRSGRPNFPKRTLQEPSSATSAHKREDFFPSQLGHSGTKKKLQKQKPSSPTSTCDCISQSAPQICYAWPLLLTKQSILLTSQQYADYGIVLPDCCCPQGNLQTNNRSSLCFEQGAGYKITAITFLTLNKETLENKKDREKQKCPPSKP